MMLKYEKFEDLPIWQQSRELASNVYKMTNVGSFAKDIGLRDQVRRSIVSVMGYVAGAKQQHRDGQCKSHWSEAKRRSIEDGCPEGGFACNEVVRESDMAFANFLKIANAAKSSEPEIQNQSHRRSSQSIIRN